ncbi:MAG: YaaC family protein [Solirubrobacteraceae bacterium]
MSAYRPFQGQPVRRVFSQYGPGLAVRWNLDAARQAGLDGIVAALARDEWCWLRPRVASVALSSLLTWWTLLFGLSMLARYEPAGWIQALDYESSELAAPLARLLDIGLVRVPDLTRGALVAVPEARDWRRSATRSDPLQDRRAAPRDTQMTCTPSPAERSGDLTSGDIPAVLRQPVADSPLVDDPAFASGVQLAS